MRRFLAERRGNVLVELALVTPILAMLTCATIDFSIYLFTLNNLTSAVRQGARRASISGAPNASTITTEVCAAMTIRATNGTTCASLVSVVDSTYLPTGCGSPPVSSTPCVGRVRVRISNFPYTPITPMANRFGFTSPVLISREAVFRSELAGA